jgi:uncharacterized protein
MRIRFNEIPPQGSRYEMHRIAELSPEEGFALDSPLEAVFSLQRKGDFQVEMDGHLKAVLTLTCDRCLETYEFAVDTSLDLLFETESVQGWHLKEVECSAEDMDTILLAEPVIDLDDILRQQLHLSLPVKRLCGDRCRGICPQCGANRNVESCSCDGANRVSPFAVLAQRKTK